MGRKDNKVHVLIKDGSTRKKVKQEIGMIKKAQIGKIKQYLKRKNLIHSGSTAPEHILREIYENAMLSGDIENTNSGVILKNYMNELQS